MIANASRLLCVAPGLALLAASAPAAAIDGPVAVMPFRNLNDDAQLAWLGTGICETMISDMRKSGRVTVVERSQVDSALAEMALQGVKGTEESTASRVGKMVGAKVMVVGGFQKAGKLLRITARFVNVETSVVLDAAKVTGPSQEVLSLQDEIVSRLLGEDPKASKPIARARRKSTPKTFQAYRLYAMSLTTASDADRVGFLKQSLDLDPEFTYAADDLKALEQRMASYSRKSEQVIEQRGRDTRRALQQQGGTPEERVQKAMQLLTSDMTSYRYKALLADATRIYALDLPPLGTMNLKEFAAYCLFLGHMSLKHDDLALQAGENYLKGFPGGLYYSSVDIQMKNLIRERQEREEGKREAEEELAKLERERAKDLAGPRPPVPIALIGLDFQRCTAMQRFHQHERTIAECQAFIEKHRNEPEANSNEIQWVFMARLAIVHALAGLGQFDRAREAADAIAAESPEFARKNSLQTITSFWPRD